MAIIDNNGFALLPWPDDTFDGWSIARNATEIAGRALTIAEFYTWPVEYRNFIQTNTGPSGDNQRMRVYQTGADNGGLLITNFAGGGVAGYNGPTVTGTPGGFGALWVGYGTPGNFSHEAGHVFDFVYSSRFGKAGFAGSGAFYTFWNTNRASIPSSVYGQNANNESWAETFRAYILRDRCSMAYTWSPRTGAALYDIHDPQVDAATTMMNTLLPFANYTYYRPCSLGQYTNGSPSIYPGASVMLYVRPDGNPTPTNLKWQVTTPGSGVWTDLTTSNPAFVSNSSGTFLAYRAVADNAVASAEPLQEPGHQGNPLVVVVTWNKAIADGADVYLSPSPFIRSPVGTAVTLYSAINGTVISVSWEENISGTWTATGVTTDTFTVTPSVAGTRQFRKRYNAIGGPIYYSGVCALIAS